MKQMWTYKLNDLSDFNQITVEDTENMDNEIYKYSRGGDINVPTIN